MLFISALRRCQNPPPDNRGEAVLEIFLSGPGKWVITSGLGRAADGHELGVDSQVARKLEGGKRQGLR